MRLKSRRKALFFQISFKSLTTLYRDVICALVCMYYSEVYLSLCKWVV